MESHYRLSESFQGVVLLIVSTTSEKKSLTDSNRLGLQEII